MVSVGVVFSSEYSSDKREQLWRLRQQKMTKEEYEAHRKRLEALGKQYQKLDQAFRNTLDRRNKDRVAEINRRLDRIEQLYPPPQPSEEVLRTSEIYTIEALEKRREEEASLKKQFPRLKYPVYPKGYFR